MKKKKLVNARVARLKHDLINETIFSISMDDSSVKLVRIALRKKWVLTIKVDNSLPFLSGYAHTAEVVRYKLHFLRVSFHNTISCKHGHYERNDVTTKPK